MDPAQAQQMWANMSPEQRAGMQNMFSNMDPSLLANMAKSMGQPELTAEQVKAMQAQAGAMGPGGLGMPDLKASERYMLDGAETRKARGNGLFAQGKYKEAMAIYAEIVTDLVPLSTTAQSKTLIKACRLNIARCKLETKEYDDVIAQCSTVLKDHPNDFKALYRRGLAREGLGHLNESVTDFEQAQKNPSSGAEVARALERVIAAREKAIAEGKPIDKPAAATAGASAGPAAGVAGPAVPTMNPAMNLAMNPAVMEAMKNPDMMRQMQQQMAAMDPEVMANMMKAQGVNAEPGQMKMAAEMMKSMKPDQMESMVNAASAMKPAPGETQAEAVKRTMSDPKLREALKDPEVLSRVNQSLSQMDPEAMASMMKSQGMEVDKEQMRMASEMMKSIDPDDMSTLMDSMSKVQPSPGQSQQEAVAEAMKDPEFRESMQKTMGKATAQIGRKLTEDPTLLNSVKSAVTAEQVQQQGEKMGYTLSERQASVVSFLAKLMVNVGILLLFIWKYTSMMLAVAFADNVRSALSTLMIAMLIAWWMGYSV